jgi:hypothetical protein
MFHPPPLKVVAVTQQRSTLWALIRSILGRTVLTPSLPVLMAGLCTLLYPLAGMWQQHEPAVMRGVF